MYTLLFEILDPPDPTPRKRYLFCNDPRHPAQVTGCDPIHARNLAALLSHPEIVVTVIEYASATRHTTAIETTTPAARPKPTDTRGSTTRSVPAEPRSPDPYAVSWPVPRRAKPQ